MTGAREAAMDSEIREAAEELVASLREALAASCAE